MAADVKNPIRLTKAQVKAAKFPLHISSKRKGQTPKKICPFEENDITKFLRR